MTGTIVYIEQADEGEDESLVLNYWSRDEFAARVRRLCQLAELDAFDVTNKGERELAEQSIKDIMEAGRENAKTERDEYLEIILDCISTFEAHQSIFKNDTPDPQVLNLHINDGKLWIDSGDGDPAVCEPVEGAEFEFKAVASDGQEFEIKFSKDDSGEYNLCNINLLSMGIEIQGTKIK